MGRPAGGVTPFRLGRFTPFPHQGLDGVLSLLGTKMRVAAMVTLDCERLNSNYPGECELVSDTTGQAFALSHTYSYLEFHDLLLRKSLRKLFV